MESVGRCQGQVGLREDCITQNLHPEEWPCTHKTRKPLLQVDVCGQTPGPWDGCCSVAQGTDLAAL